MSSDSTITPTNGQPTPEQKPIIDLMSLDDLAVLDVTVLIEHGNHTLRIPMRTLTHFEWNDIGMSVPNPAPPIMGIDPTTKRPLPDMRDPGYQKAMQQAEGERNYRRLAQSLKVSIPGETLGDKADTLKRTLDASVTRQLMSVLLSFALEGEGRIASRSETFQRNGDSHDADLRPNGVVAAAMAIA